MAHSTMCTPYRHCPVWAEEYRASPRAEFTATPGLHTAAAGAMCFPRLIAAKVARPTLIDD